jgi:SAM-dependent methyltransferase
MLKKIKTFVSNREEYYPNVEIFSYHIIKAVKKGLLRIGIIKPGAHGKDMFDWPLYHLHYRGELKQNAKHSSLTLKPGDYAFENNKLVQKNTSIKPLHFSPKFIYETIMQLKPASVFEMGCGTGVNLQCMKTLLPDARVCGVDLLPQQLATLKKNFPELASSVKQADATIPFQTLPFEPCDVVFTQAVLMHIHTDNKHLIALKNIFAMSKKYVVLMEGIRGRNYKADIEKLHAEKKIKWNKIYFYYRVNEETNKPNGIICSSTPLPYPELTDYSIFHAKNN